MKTQRKLMALAAGAALVAAGCGHSSSSSSGNSGGSGGGGGTTITVGLLYDGTGLAASGNKTAPIGVQAGIAQAKKDGYTVKMYTADTQSSPASAEAAAQKLVDQDNVDVVFTQSSLAFAAAPWLKSHNVPVIGAAEDSTEWTTDTNMFGITGPIHETLVNTDYGQIFKKLGATNIGVIGYSISPVSADSAKGVKDSDTAAGIKTGYLNANFPFGSTNVTPAALAMKAAGVNGFTGSTDPNTEFSMVQELRNLGVKLKAIILPTGYGADLTQAGPNATSVGKGMTFLTAQEPIEMKTAATKQFSSDLASVGVKGDPAYAEYDGYADVALLEQALKHDGGSSKSADILKGLSQVTSFNDWGLMPHGVDVSNRAPSANDNCEYYTTWNGSAFQLIPGADPYCGTIVHN